MVVKHLLRDGPWLSHWTGLSLESERFRKAHIPTEHLTNNHGMLFYPEHIIKDQYYLEKMTSAQHQIYILPRIYGILVKNMFGDQILDISKGSSTLLCYRNKDKTTQTNSPAPVISAPSVL